MKRKRIAAGVIVVALLAMAIATIEHCYSLEKCYHDYKSIQKGMTQVEVESILGRGILTSQSSLPIYVGPVARVDEIEILERVKNSDTVLTQKNNHVIYRFAVEGDLIFMWERKHQKIFVAFNDGKVCDTDLYEGNKY